MNSKKRLLIAIMGLGLVIACGDKKGKDDHGHSHDKSAVKEIKIGDSKDASKIKAAKKRVADSLKRVDSLQQVKEHGHVH